jgi:tRNA A-37 threonylcarbamoyl transferase component Bud32
VPADRTHRDAYTHTSAHPSTGSFPLPLDTAPTPVPPADEPPPAIPGYEVGEKLGSGAIGAVYRARHLGLDQWRAVKVLRGDILLAPGEADRLRAEARFIADLDAPGIVRVYDVGEAGGRPYFVMELAAGGSLADRLRHGPLDVAEAVEVALGVTAGVAAAHDRDVVHRDLKPGNVLFDAAGAVKVADFGLALRLVNGENPTASDFRVAGTAAYMSPEQADGKIKEVGRRSDVWAVGVILYECLTGVSPFAGRNFVDSLDRVRYDRIIRPRKHRRDIPPAVEAVCLKCLSRRPADRYCSAREVGAALRAAVGASPRRSRAGYGLAAAAVVLLAGGVMLNRPKPAVAVAPTPATVAPPAPAPTPADPLEEIVVPKSVSVAPRPPEVTLRLVNGVGYAFLVIGSQEPRKGRKSAVDERTWLTALHGLVPAANRNVLRGYGEGRLTADAVRAELAAFARRPGPGDTLFVVFVGVGCSDPERLDDGNFAYCADATDRAGSLVWASEVAAALEPSAAKVKMVFWDVDRVMDEDTPAGPAGGRPFDGLSGFSAVLGCRAGGYLTDDAVHGSHFSHCVCRLLGGRVPEALTGGVLPVGAFRTRLPAEYKRLRDEVQIPEQGLDPAAVTPEQVGPLSGKTPLLRRID